MRQDNQGKTCRRCVVTDRFLAPCRAVASYLKMVWAKLRVALAVGTHAAAREVWGRAPPGHSEIVSEAILLKFTDGKYGLSECSSCHQVGNR